ncbi:MAG: hypothetical protein RIB84_17800, partial [Sneathiellaceae bacterium]
PPIVTTALVAVVHGAARFNNGLILLRCGAMGCRASPGDRDKPAHDEAIKRMRPENGTQPDSSGLDPAVQPGAGLNSGRT